ncbi:invasion associated locus B family protein [Epibacterium ulvae]|uniref:Invasion protein IalB, involved in pathogenesis n=1 Tax=Epibacterium ulvae TaxID=1156985 RepID=A0A1G5Q8D4_9RHOB|nr:invasion associated locus B family protein [Epibacterium ulvae]SCZ57730.1 Invasion protein IalB, involved in pathogenesis [Epibacterium ulvae]
MLKSLTSLSVAALLACTAPVIAQDTATPDESAATEAPVSDPSLDLGQPVQEGPRLGERYSKEKHGDWDLACVKTEEEVDPCSLLQIILDSQGAPMAEFSLFRIEQQGSPAVAGATVIVPLETLLSEGLTLSVDGAPAKRYGYSFCNSLGCVAQIGLVQGDIDAMKKGAEATLSLRPAPAPDQVINMALSLKGFTAGFNVVDVVKQ